MSTTAPQPIATAADLAEYVHFPKPTPVTLINLDNLQEEGGALDQIKGPVELVVFLDKKDPKAMQQHPILGPMLPDSVFVETDGKTTLINTRYTVPAGVEGVSRTVHFVMGAGTEGSADPDGEFELPFKWRDAVADGIGDVIERIAREREKGGQGGIAMYFDPATLNHENGPAIARAVAQATGNLHVQSGLHQTQETARLHNGVPPAREALPATGVETLDAVRRDARRGIGDVVWMSGALRDAPGIAKAAQEGDMRSRLLAFSRLLAECPYDIMKCKVLLAAIVQMAREAREKAPAMGFEVEIVAPKGDQLEEMIGDMPGVTVRTFDEVAADLQGATGQKDAGMNLLTGVHGGTDKTKDPGPYAVYVHYRHPEAPADEGVRVRGFKGITFDTGGYSLKPTDAMLEMYADMSLAGTGAAMLGRLGEEQPRHKITFCFGIASNHVGGWPAGSRVTAASGVKVLIENTDAEGRLVLADVLAYGLYALHKKGEAAQQVGAAATLTGASMLYDKGFPTVVSRSELRGRALRDHANAHGERLVARQRTSMDRRAMAEDVGNADVTNLSGLHQGPLRARGVTTGQEFIARAAGLSGELDRTFTGWDVAMVLDTSPGLPKDLKGGVLPMEAPYDTMWHDLVAA